MTADVSALQLFDPELDAFVDETRSMNELIAAFMANVPNETWSTEEGLQFLRANNLGGESPLDDTEVRTIEGPDGNALELRIQTPTAVASGAAAPRAVYYDIHGGGWCLGSAGQQDTRNRALAERLGVVTVSVEYRLAPEHPFPAALDDCETAGVWIAKHAAKEFGSDVLLIGGGSAGGHLAAATLLRLRDRHDLAGRFVGANLVFGAFDLGMTPSQRNGHDLLVIPTPVLEQCVAYAMPGLSPEERRDPDYSPLYADLSDLPPAIFTIGTLDPLLDDSLFMAQRWVAAGNRAELAVYPESVHGFIAFPTQMAAHALARMESFLDTCLT